MIKRKTGCDCRTLLLRRIFQEAASIAVNTDPQWGPMALAVLLGIHEEAAIVLCRMGLVAQAPGMPWAGADRVSAANVLRFLEQDGIWLALLRVEQQILTLRAAVARERRAKARRGRRAPARARKGA